MSQVVLYSVSSSGENLRLASKDGRARRPDDPGDLPKRQKQNVGGTEVVCKHIWLVLWNINI